MTPNYSLYLLTFHLRTSGFRLHWRIRVDYKLSNMKLLNQIKLLLTSAFVSSLLFSNEMSAQNNGSLRIAPLGDTIELELNTDSSDDYILETQAQLMEGEKWAPLMQFRGNAGQPKRFVDPICGDKSAKFFRLRKLLEAPRPEVSNFRLLDFNGKAHELYYNTPAKFFWLETKKS